MLNTLTGISEVLSFFSALIIIIFPLWKTIGTKKRTALIVALVLYRIIWSFVFAYGQFNTQMFSLLRLLMSIIPFIALFFLFRKQIWQTVFLCSMVFLFTPICLGVSQYISKNRFTEFTEYQFLLENLLAFIIAVITLPPLLIMLKRLCLNPDTQKAKFWKFIWLLPATFFMMVMVSGNSYLTTSDHGLGFIVIRLFIYIALFLTCFLLNVSLRQVSENITIKEHARMAENLLSLQREQYTRLIKNAEAVETMRHDIRHQLVAAKSFSQAGDNEGLNQYLDELYGNVPAPEKMYCKNYIVNAVVNHYLFSLEESIKLDVKLDIPEDTGVITSADLCVIMGNLLENAVEACRIIENSEQSENFIRAYSLIQGDCISIMVENSFNGICNEEDGIYYSHKRDNQREGIGLSSVKAVCEKYDGRTLIEVNDNVWKSSALVYMK